jgi:hypothetical protein
MNSISIQVNSTSIFGFPKWKLRMESRQKGKLSSNPAKEKSGKDQMMKFSKYTIGTIFHGYCALLKVLISPSLEAKPIRTSNTSKFQLSTAATTPP